MIRGWESIEVVSVTTTDSNRKPLSLGDKFHAEIVLDLNELSGNDIGIEAIFGQKENDEVKKILYKKEMDIVSSDSTLVTYACDIPSDRVGVFDYAFRIYPRNSLLANRQEFNLMKWL